MTTAPVHRPQLAADNITLAKGAGRGVGMALIVVGLLAALAVLGMGLSGAAGVTKKHALAVYHTGAMGVLAMALGGLFFTMVFHLTNAGWSATIRRQCENLASFLPFAWLLVLPALVIEIANHGLLFAWLNPAYYHDHALQVKSAFFYLPNHIVDHDTHKVATEPVLPVFFLARALVYGVVWTLLSRRLCALSRAQDASPSVELAAKARFTSSWGMLLFALTTAFASFDWLMSVDFKFFSTMWPVWYFSGAAFSAMALLVLVFARLKAVGKLEGVVTSEHFHDKGKILFSFTVFWAYISFSQYFLIWYGNIPEETAYYYFRTFEGSPWRTLGITLMIGHFIAPFLIVLFRPVKKSPLALGLVALWCLGMHFADIYFVLRPMVDAGTGLPPHIMGHLWVDLAAIVGLFAVLVGFLIVKIPGLSLVAHNDPWIDESLEHRNYV
ncbi:MAG: membrane protein [Phycisphaerae bacterium]|nr:MAG: membrane protein [Phycisphaerae bacterium]